MTTRIVVLADTHIRRGSRRRLPDEVRAAVGEADAVLHAGDVVIPEVLDDLGRHAPTWAVLGNNDNELIGSLPETLRLELEGVQIGMVHDSGPRRGREARLRRQFPDADLVVFGHSHIPLDTVGIDGQRLLNPGSPTERRAQPRHTYAVVELDGGRVAGVELRSIEPA